MFAMQANEMTEGLREKLPPTDSRLRPDLCHLERGNYDKVPTPALPASGGPPPHFVLVPVSFEYCMDIAVANMSCTCTCLAQTPPTPGRNVVLPVAVWLSGNGSKPALDKLM